MPDPTTLVTPQRFVAKPACDHLVYQIPCAMSDSLPRSGPTLDVPRLDTETTFAKEAYAALKRAICAMDIYDHPAEIRLDKRRLSEGLGVSRTPIREAMTLLEQ